jgi:DNA-binding NtrC family response regulator
MDLFNELKKMKILLIDDDEWVRDSLTLFLESEGCHLKALETAEEGLKALKDEKYDIIITDYWLPGMDGLEFLSRVYNSTSNALKILITAYGNHSVIEKAKALGVHSLIAKPFSSASLEYVLQQMLETAQRTKSQFNANSSE